MKKICVLILFILFTTKSYSEILNFSCVNSPDRGTHEFIKIALDKNKKYAAKINELRMTSKDAAKKIPNETFDFSYIDGDHSLRGITIDLNVLYSKTRVNGLIGGDDFTRNIWQHSNKYDPTEVFPYAIYFAEANDCTIFTLPYNQFLIFKNSSFEVFDYGNYSELTVKQIYSKKSYIESLKKIVHNKLVNLSKK